MRRLLVIGLLCLTGCSGVVADDKQWETDITSPIVVYANPDAWSCDLTKAVNTRGQAEDCILCLNRARHFEPVSINGSTSSVPPGGSTLRCLDSTSVRDATMAPISEGSR